MIADLAYPKASGLIVLLCVPFVLTASAVAQEASPPPTATSDQPPKESAEPSVERSPAEIEAEISAAKDGLVKLEQARDDAERRPIIKNVTAHMQAVQDSDPDNPYLSFLYGKAYALLGRDREAIDQLKTYLALREGRTDWEAHRLLGDLVVVDYPSLAKASYVKALALRPGAASVLHGLSVCARKLGRIADSIAFSRQAVSADGRQTVRYLNQLAEAFSANGQWDAAVREASIALDRAKVVAGEHAGRREPLRAIDAQYRLLINLMQNRIREVPDDVEQFLQMATYVRERALNTTAMGLHDVVAVYEHASDRPALADSPQLLEPYGIALGEVGRRDDAIAVFERLLGIEPNNVIAQTQLDLLRVQGASGL